ncbi:WWE domain-containing protein [Durusdinium trenchii]|uniref:WWE domain-containing protein n=1 Tax=Durusdinium trenchii TaxID=1381693 RepID=A0ABP0MWL7_9DINO
MTTAVAFSHRCSGMRPEDQEAYALRVFHLFPELFHLLGDPSLPQHFDPSRSVVDLQESVLQTVLRVHLARQPSDDTLPRPVPSAPAVSFDISTPLQAPSRDPLSDAIGSLQPLAVPQDYQPPTAPASFPAVPLSPVGEGLVPKRPDAVKPQLQRSKSKVLESGLMQKSTPLLPDISGILAESKLRGREKTVSPSKERLERSYDDEDEDWHPGQSSDEELMRRKKAPPECLMDGTPSSAGHGPESPLFPWKGLDSTVSSSSTSSAHMPHVPSGPRLRRGLSPSQSLAGRRGLQLQLARGRSAPVPEDDMGSLQSHSTSPANSIGLMSGPGVQLVSPPRRISRTKTLPADLRRVQPSPYVPRPRPVSFPNRQNVIFFDWDDTLCPTSWIRSLLKEHMADVEEWVDQDHFVDREEDWRDSIPSWFKQPLPDEPHVREIIKHVQKACIKLIQVANNLGLVFVVTNAVPGWVEKTIKRWLPELRSYIGSSHSERPIKVIYAQQAYVEIDPTLQFADEQGEYMLWKKAAMDGVLAELDSLVVQAEGTCPRRGRIANVLSIGDTEAEMTAAQLASLNFDSGRQRPRVGKRYHRRCGLADLDTGAWPRGAQCFASEDGSHSSGSEGWNPTKERRPQGRQFGGGYRHSVDVPWSCHWPWVKLIKLHEGCQARHLAVQMDEIGELLPKMMACRKHVRVNLSEDCRINPSELEGPPPAQRRRLRTESI